MSQDNKDLVRRWFEEVWNKGRADAIDEMLAADGIVYGLSDENDSPLRGAVAFRGFHQNFKSAFPDITVSVEDVIAEGDKVVARCTVRGQHMGDSLGFAATERSVEFTGIAIARIENGQIVEA